MTKISTVEIRFEDSEIIIEPCRKVINRRAEARQISAEVTAALDQPRPRLVTDMIIDLGQVDWISSVGLSELIRLQSLSRASGLTLRLRSLNETVRDVLRITRLERVFEFDGDSVKNPLMASASQAESAGINL